MSTFRIVCIYTGRLLWEGEAASPTNARNLARKSGNPGACHAYAHSSVAVEMTAADFDAPAPLPAVALPSPRVADAIRALPSLPAGLVRAYSTERAVPLPVARLETLFIVLADGRIFCSGELPFSWSFARPGASWVQCDDIPADADFIGNYPRPVGAGA